MKPVSVDNNTGLVDLATYIPSPNYDDRMPNTSVSLLVIHNISLPPGQFGSGAVIDFFLNQLDYGAHPYYEQLIDLKVSSHLFITRAGELIQFVPLHKRAWHAGQSSFKGQVDCNQFSIGIELEGTDNLPYTDSQYEQLIAVTAGIRQYAPAITSDRIVGHQDIAPGRKTDPGPSFDWLRYLQNVEEKV